MIASPSKAWFACATALLLLSVSVAHAFLDELTPAQQAQVKSGKQVVVTEDVGKSWPLVRVYRTISATPEEVSAVFFDYDNAKSFVPNLLKSEVIAKNSPQVIDVDYILDVPILPDEYYSIRNSVKALGDGAYRFDWKLLRATSTKETVGCLRLKAFGDGTIICYQNLVTPGSGMAVLLKGKAISQMGDTAAALARQVEQLKQSDPGALAREVKALREACK